MQVSSSRLAGRRRQDATTWSRGTTFITKPNRKDRESLHPHLLVTCSVVTMLINIRTIHLLNQTVPVIVSVCPRLAFTYFFPHCDATFDLGQRLSPDGVTYSRWLPILAFETHYIVH